MNERDALNSRLKEKHKKWHRKIRELLELSPDSKDDINCDFDVLLEFWSIPKKDLINVFSEINGIEDIFSEIIDFTQSKILKGKAFKDYETLVKSNIQKTIKKLSNYVDTHDIEKMPIKIEKGDWQEDYNKSKYLMSLTENFDDALYDEILQKGGELKHALAYFLSEPLYRISTSYLPVYYFNWKLTGASDDLNPYKYLFELSRDYDTNVMICENEIKVYANNYFE